MVKHPQAPTRWVLPTEPQSVALARSLARTTLGGWSLNPDRVDDVLLIVSELVTNALVHARPTVAFALLQLPGGLRGEVSDHGPLASLIPCHVDHAATSGRGLRLVGEVSDKWGVDWDLDKGVKTVWFEVTVSV